MGLWSKKCQASKLGCLIDIPVIYIFTLCPISSDFNHKAHPCLFQSLLLNKCDSSRPKWQCNDRIHINSSWNVWCFCMWRLHLLIYCNFVPMHQCQILVHQQFDNIRFWYSMYEAYGISEPGLCSIFGDKREPDAASWFDVMPDMILKRHEWPSYNRRKLRGKILVDTPTWICYDIWPPARHIDHQPNIGSLL